MNLIYTIETNNEQICFHYVSKRLVTVGDSVEVNLTTTESKFLLKLCQSKIQGVIVISRTEMESYIWGDGTSGIDRKANLNQLVCTLRKKLGKISVLPVIITQPKKGYSLDDCMHIKPVTNDAPPKLSGGTSHHVIGNYWSKMARYRFPAMAFVAIAVNGMCLLLPPVTEKGSRVTVEETALNNTVITAIKEHAMTINCIRKESDINRFTNYFVLNLNEKDISDDLRREVCANI